MRFIDAIFLLFWSTIIFAEIKNDNEFLINVVEEKNLPLLYSESVYQDEEGFIWLGYNGLTRFDGSEFVSFSYDSSDSTSIISDIVTDICPDKNQNLWLATKNGVCLFNINTYRFTDYSNSELAGIGEKYTNSLCFLDSVHLLVGTMNDGLFLLNTISGQTQQFEFKDDTTSIAGNTIYKIIKTSKGNILVGTGMGLDLYDYAKNLFTHLIREVDVRDLSEMTPGKILVSTYADNSFLILDEESEAISEKVSLPKIFGGKQKRICFDSQGDLWVGVLDRGLYKITFTSSPEIQLVRNSNSFYNRTIRGPLRIIEDRNSNIWVTSFSEGIFLLDRNRKPFDLVFNSLSFGDFDCRSVRNLFQDNDGNIWVGARNGGVLSSYDLQAGKFKDYLLHYGDVEKVIDELILSISDGSDNRLWIGSLHSGLWYLDKKRNQLLKYHHLKGSESVAKNTIYGLLQDGDNLWIGYAGAGIDVLNLKTGKMTSFTHDPDHLNTISDNFIRTIYKDKKDNIWVGTLNKGINRYDAINKCFIRLPLSSDDTNSLIDNRVHSIYHDHQDRIWIGTFGGINLLNNDSVSFTRFGKKEGFQFKSVINIIEDDNNNLWLNGEIGISKFNMQHKTFRNYTSQDGTLSLIHTACRLNSGLLMFGGQEGINLFNPEEIRDNIEPLKVILTDFKLNNQSVITGVSSVLQKNITKTDDIILSYKDKLITIEYGALAFGNVTGISFSYRLVGFNDEWTDIGDVRSVTYTNLKPGDYNFEVRAINSDGISSGSPRRLLITITPPFWKTIWAYIFYAFVIVFIVLKYRSILIKRQIEKRNKQLNEERLNLFTNIAHEFSTPLTLMLNPVEELLTGNNDKSAKEKLSIVHKSASKLMHLVQQLLQLRKLDAGKETLNLEQVDLVQYTDQIVQLFAPLAQSKGLKMAFQSEVDELICPVDMDKYEKILNNLISNAIKYTRQDGDIRVEINRLKHQFINNRKLVDCASVKISDTGIGMTREEKENAFNRYYQAGVHGKGIGIGLNYVIKLIEFHRGDIQLESEKDKGSVFTLFFPLGNEFYKEEVVIESSDQKQQSGNKMLEVLEYDLLTSDEHALDDETAESGDHKKTVLFVEDNKILLNQLKDHFNKKFKVITASNGREGLDKALKYVPDIVVSDVMMPVMDGFELCQKIKSSEDICHIPVVMLTARGMVEDRLSGYEFGADEYFSKPFVMKLLEARINNLIAGRIRLKEKFNSSNIMNDFVESEQMENRDEKFLNQVTKYVIDNLDNSDMVVSEISHAVGISNSQLFNRISQLTGQNPSGFIRTIRLKCSAELLKNNDYDIKEITYKVGFNSHAYFSKCFKELYGCSPTQFKEQHS